MKVKVLLFGSLANITGCNTLEAENVTDIFSLKMMMENKFTALSRQKYAIAVNGELTHDNVVLTSHSEVAFLPPFAGG